MVCVSIADSRRHRNGLLYRTTPDGTKSYSDNRIRFEFRRPLEASLFCGTNFDILLCDPLIDVDKTSDSAPYLIFTGISELYSG